ncbi:hypothetical protein PI23P_04242 [Polaribacter irgensii 23-P]|jgi:hypothetical protein|uniref:Uncharacterized protein n=1 Tax=Polaribacter irgensii 23-P TaxID=313594 RepID=A4BXI5_9FLAO|nr:hypothetical protein [Polaribacter irgensii]EAR13676.1 hypothetical protein PI23P_04242 [Polaribacter irgensii 23-P]
MAKGIQFRNTLKKTAPRSSILVLFPEWVLISFERKIKIYASKKLSIFTENGNIFLTGE